MVVLGRVNLALDGARPHRRGTNIQIEGLNKYKSIVLPASLLLLAILGNSSGQGSIDVQPSPIDLFEAGKSVSGAKWGGKRAEVGAGGMASSRTELGPSPPRIQPRSSVPQRNPSPLDTVVPLLASMRVPFARVRAGGPEARDAIDSLSTAHLKKVNDVLGRVSTARSEAPQLLRTMMHDVLGEGNAQAQQRSARRMLLASHSDKNQSVNAKELTLVLNWMKSQPSDDRIGNS